MFAFFCSFVFEVGVKFFCRFLDFYFILLTLNFFLKSVLFKVKNSFMLFLLIVALPLQDVEVLH